MLFFFNQNKSVDFLNNSTKYIVYRQHLALDYVQSLLKSKEIVRKPNAEFVLFRKLLEIHLEKYLSLKSSLPFIPEGSISLALFGCRVLLIYGTRLEIRKLETREDC